MGMIRKFKSGSLWQEQGVFGSAHLSNPAELADAAVPTRSIAEGFGFASTHASIVGTTPTDSLLRSWLGRAGFSVTAQPTLDEMIDELAADPDNTGIVFVEIESLGGITQTIEALLEIRKIAPAVTLVLLSEKATVSEFGTERLAICDATVKSPIGWKSLVEALEQAKTNNKIWQDRRLS